MAYWQDLCVEKEHSGLKPGNLTNTNAEGNSRQAREGRKKCNARQQELQEVKREREREIGREYRRERTSRTTFPPNDDPSQPRNYDKNICYNKICV